MVREFEKNSFTDVCLVGPEEDRECGSSHICLSLRISVLTSQSAM